MKEKKIKITGLVEMYLTDQKTGIKKKIYEHENRIYTEFYELLARNIVDFDSDAELALDNLFVTCVGQPPNGYDGIVLLFEIIGGDAELFYSLKTTLSQPAANKFRATGLYDAGVAIDVISLDLGINWQGTSQGGQFQNSNPGKQIATHQPSGVSIPVSTNYTVVWTLEFTVY